jgi:drug/metabolite transporter (DMT)-like permease
MTVGVALRLVGIMGLWAACFPLITIGLGLAPHLAFAAMRAAVAGLCLLFLGAVLRRPMPGGARIWRLIAVVAIGDTTLGFLGMFHAAEFVSPGLATVIYNAQPLLAAVLAHVILGERLKALGRVGLLAGFAGIIVIAWPGLASGEVRGYALGIAYIALAVTGEAVSNVALKRLPDEIDAMMVMGVQLLLGAAPLALWSMWTEPVSTLSWSTKFVAVLVMLSVLGTALPYWLWFAAIKQVELSRANAFRFLTPLLGLAIGAAFFDERLGWVEAAGAVLILTGIVVVQYDAKTRTVQKHPVGPD